MTKKFIKSKSVAGGPNASGPKYRTPDHFKASLSAGKASIFSGGNTKNTPPRVKFNPAQFKVQHKG
jgi:hypothetical protein